MLKFRLARRQTNLPTAVQGLDSRNGLEPFLMKEATEMKPLENVDIVTDIISLPGELPFDDFARKSLTFVKAVHSA
jgi:hypothetical protein